MKFAPQLYRAFQSAVFTQVVVLQDSGFGIFSWLLKLGRRIPIMLGPGAIAGHVAVIGTLVLALVLLRRHRHLPAVANLWVPALLVMAILANPRIQSYDADIAYIPAVYLWVEWFRTEPPSQSRTLGIAFAGAVFAALLSREAYLATYLLLLGSVALVIVRLRTAGIRAASGLEGAIVNVP